MAALAAVGALAMSGPAAASTDLAKNGGFEQSAYPHDGLERYWTTAGLPYITDWTTFGNPGLIGFYFPPGGGTNSQLPASYTSGAGTRAAGATQNDPAGGYFVGFDGEPAYGGYPAQDTGLYQQISGLTVGDNYELSFYWAAAQAYPSNGAPFYMTMHYELGTNSADVRQTQTLNELVGDFSERYSGWLQVKAFFTAKATGEVLAFWAEGGPYATPPLALLDGVSLTAVPEPSTWALLGLGFAGLGFAARRHAKRKAAPLAA